MRADTLKQQLQPAVFTVIDTHVPFYKTHKLWRTLAFRYKTGPTIIAINAYIKRQIGAVNYDLIWVDKATFIRLSTTKLLRIRAKKLIHYSPDMMFYANKSQAFCKSLTLYDAVVTTKRKELPYYEAYMEKSRIILTTQGYAPEVHNSQLSFEEKTDTVVFIGLAEPSREAMLQYLIDYDITVQLVGFGWHSFVKRNERNNYLKYLGTAVYGEAYSQLISASKFGLGLLSKRIPELHTTRTFEIPACGTALLTERNEELSEVFNEDEVIYYNSKHELLDRIRYYLKFPNELKIITDKGQNRVTNSGYDYNSIITDILDKIQE